MKRREFITLLGSTTTLAWTVAALAQHDGRLARIGFLGSSTASAMGPWTAAFVQRLGELGWVNGRNLTIDYRFAEGRSERYAEIADDFVRQNVDLIVTYGTPPTKAAKAATAAIPIVFAAAADPIGSGLVASLAQPGGNVTGLSLQQSDIVGKKLELLREVLGDFRRLAVAGNAANLGSVLEINEVATAAAGLGIEITTLELRRVEDIAPAFEMLGRSAQAVYVSTDPFILSNVELINALALDARLPTVYNGKEYLESGGFLSYGPNYPDLFRHAADFVDRILRGAKPEDLPVQQPTRFDLVINQKTAKALGLAIPPLLLARASEIIE